MSADAVGRQAALAERADVAVRVMALLDMPGIGPAAVNRLVTKFGSLTALVKAIEEPASRPSSGPIKRIRAWWASVNVAKYKAWLQEAEDLGCDVILRDDPEYPSNLRDVTSAPPILYVRGSLALLSPRALALVGAVDPTARGLARARRLARLCTESSIQVISGLARGIDGEAHRAALESGAPTFAVVGHGLRHLYPPEHRDLAREITRSGALISQFAPSAPPSRWTFPARNELMCTIASGTVIVEIERDEKFGTVIQARHSM
jgi:DNA protecting protein DprA